MRTFISILSLIISIVAAAIAFDLYLREEYLLAVGAFLIPLVLVWIVISTS